MVVGMLWRCASTRARQGIPIAMAVVALVYVVLAIAASWQSPDLGFRIRLGRQVVWAEAGSDIHVRDRL